VFIGDHIPQNLMNVLKPCVEGPLVGHLIHKSLSLVDESLFLPLIKNIPIVRVILLRCQAQIQVRLGIAVLPNLLNDVKVVHLSYHRYKTNMNEIYTTNFVCIACVIYRVSRGDNSPRGEVSRENHSRD